jgi:hypothetical protein
MLMMNMMKNIKWFTVLLLTVLSLTACELDNYPEPDASLSGAILDVDTGEPVQGAIISGTKIEIIEQGFENPQPRYLVVKADGTYRNDMIFSGDYKIVPLRRGNFVPQPENDTIDVKISGPTIQNFEVLPYIRIEDPSITVDGTVVTAKFRIEQNVANNVVRVALFAHESPSVCEILQVKRRMKTLNRVVDESEEFELVMDVSGDEDFTLGNEYHFRIGALIKADEAEYNYSPAVRLKVE